jgi:serine/threonine protein phosphatase PrpC
MILSKQHRVTLQIHLVALIILTVLTISAISVFLDYRREHIIFFCQSTISKVNLSVGDRIFLYTDGVTDTGVTKGQNVPYNLGKILLNCNDLCLTEQVATLMSEAIRYSGGEIKDDATIVAFEVLHKVVS